MQWMALDFDSAYWVVFFVKSKLLKHFDALVIAKVWEQALIFGCATEERVVKLGPTQRHSNN